MSKSSLSLVSILAAGIIALASYFYPSMKGIITPAEADLAEADYVLYFPADRYPETADHIKEAIESGESAICTIDREGAEENRKESLDGTPTKESYDRDEWPMAMCAEGGAGANIAYIDPSDNRGAGSWVGNQLEDYPDGTTVRFIVD